MLVRDCTDEVLRLEADGEFRTDGEYLELIRRLEVCSLLVVPVTFSVSLATITFLMTSESRRRFGEEDVAVAEELVERAAQIVESARVHRRLRQTEARFRMALAHSNITLFEQDAAGRYTWIYNPPLGFAASEIVGRTTRELVASALSRLYPSGVIRRRGNNLYIMNRAAVEDIVHAARQAEAI